MSAYNSNNYTLGMAELVFYEDTSPTYDYTSHATWTIGNIVVASIAPEITFLDHYTTTNGSRKKDRSLITNKALAVNFTFDEITAGAMKEWLLASASKTELTGTGVEIYPLARGEVKGCAKLEFNTEFGRDYTWYIPCASLKPDGTFDFNSEDWMNAKGILECLVNEKGDVNKPFGKIVFDEANQYENYV
jgi:hypothetical protein